VESPSSSQPENNSFSMTGALSTFPNIVKNVQRCAESELGEYLLRLTSLAPSVVRARPFHSGRNRIDQCCVAPVSTTKDESSRRSAVQFASQDRKSRKGLMELLSRVAFYHKHNEDETWDSICMKCFLTVATSARQDALAEQERHHDCDELINLL